MRTASLISAFGILSLALLAGCTSETLESDLIKTKGIAATVEVSATNDNASTVLVTLRAGGDDSNRKLSTCLRHRVVEITEA
ncbi:MAG: hypothetical protein WKG00_18430 [Polyangiaceae bacterium]